MGLSDDADDEDDEEDVAQRDAVCHVPEYETVSGR
jgi:hypothetical protein